jgi:hypothetical protein
MLLIFRNPLLKKSGFFVFMGCRNNSPIGLGAYYPYSEEYSLRKFYLDFRY